MNSILFSLVGVPPTLPAMSYLNSLCPIFLSSRRPKLREYRDLVVNRADVNKFSIIGSLSDYILNRTSSDASDAEFPGLNAERLTFRKALTPDRHLPPT